MNDIASPLNSALEQLRIKLLDLTGRNRLINFKHTPGKSIQFVNGHPAAIFKKLMETTNKAQVTILGLPEPTKKDWSERHGRLQRPDPHEWAKTNKLPTNYEISGLGQDSEISNLSTLMYVDDLAKHCRKIEREAKLAIEETGANMLFLVLGFLEFPDQRNSDKSMTSPLISIPVAFQKSEVAGAQIFSLQYTGDDISENLSLREKLRNDFGLILPELPEDLIDVNEYFSKVLTAIKNQPSFTLKHRVSLCLLSFSNMLLVRDLDPTKWPYEDNKNSLTNHPIVREVFEGVADQGGRGLSLASEHPVEEGPGALIPLVYDADSSQHSALVDVLSFKKNLVIEGPPGTGKSQTITNLIAACLAEGKKVLFVAEKLAALEVVKNRLSLAGLDPFVLELHSNKTNKKNVLEEISKRLSIRSKNPSDLPRLQKQLESHRNELKAYSELINSVAYNALGLTLHQIIWRAEKHRQKLTDADKLLSQVSIDDATQVSEFDFSRRLDFLGYLSSQYKFIGGFDDSCTFWGFYPDRILPGEEVKLINLFETADQWGLALIGAVKNLSHVLGGRIYNLSLTFCRDQLTVLKSLQDSANEELPFHLTPNFFAGDVKGEKAESEIFKFSKQIEKFNTLASTVNLALNDESLITRLIIDRLEALQSLGHNLGVKFGTFAELKLLHQQLTEAVEKLLGSHIEVVTFTNSKNIPYNGSKKKLEQLLNFTDLILQAPEDFLHLQTLGLTRDSAVQALEQLLVLQNEWIELEKLLAEELYVDTIPDEAELKQAILTLREGDAWFRPFQARWRKAVGLHKSLQRFKHKKSGLQRLEHLERVLKLIGLKDRWKASLTWTQFIGMSAQNQPFPLEDYLCLAKWNRAIKAASEDIQTSLIDLVGLTSEQVRTLRREFISLKPLLISSLNAFNIIYEKIRKLDVVTGNDLIDKVLVKTNDFIDAISGHFEWLESQTKVQATLSEIIEGCHAALERFELKLDIESNTRIKFLLGDFYNGIETDCASALDALSFGQSIDGLNLSPQVKYKLRSGHPIQQCQSVASALQEVFNGLYQIESMAKALESFGSFELEKWVGEALDEDLDIFVAAFHSAVKNAIRDSDLLIPWSLYLTRRKEANDLALSEFVIRLENKRIKPDELVDAYGYCFFSSIIQEAFRGFTDLGRFSGLKHNQIKDEFKRLDKEIIAMRGQAIAHECSLKASPPSGRSGARIDDRTEMVLLNYLMPQQRPRMPVRKILTRAGVSIQELKPCFMMGPQAVAQFLTPGVIKFDLVIMDEASQLKPEEAIGSIARGGQLVVVGDPKQLPPTSFFSRMTEESDDPDGGFITSDAESILDVCSSHFKPIRSLRWHYRSQHHSLIAFSNHHFYRGNLVIFPSPYGQGGKLGVRATYLADAIYENQTNLREAIRVVDAVVEHIATRPQDSLGIVTLNIKQRDLIAEFLDERLKSAHGADVYREFWANEGQPLFIKNLENVQGDERDAIIISTTFGKPPGSRVVRQNFGPISRQGGWRRLNVLFTRAKKSIAIYTSIRPEDIVVDGSTPDGTKALRNYLEYARTGLLATFEETGREPDSDFEVSVMDVLKLHGYEVTPQLGVAGFRIDIAVRHPDAPGAYLAAIECDGATYHSALSVRDRDRIRQEILESLGWRNRIWRIWSTDWFRSPKQETLKLVSFLEELRKSWKPDYPSGESWIEEGRVANKLSTDSNMPKSPKSDVGQVNTQPKVVPASLKESDDLEVQVGDVVRYVDLSKIEDVLTVQITRGQDDFSNGIVNESRPIAQVLLGTVLGEEVTLHLIGNASKKFKVIEIVKKKH